MRVEVAAQGVETTRRNNTPSNCRWPLKASFGFVWSATVQIKWCRRKGAIKGEQLRAFKPGKTPVDTKTLTRRTANGAPALKANQFPALTKQPQTAPQPTYFEKRL